VNFKTLWIVGLSVLLLNLVSNNASAEARRRHSSDSLETLDNDPATTPTKSGEGARRKLSSTSNIEEDIEHFENIDRHIEVSLGMFIPMGDFQNEFNYAPSIALHYVWESISPFAFSVGFERASADHKSNPQLGKLSVNEITVGTRAKFPVGRFVPFVKIEGAFDFNDVSFGGAVGSTPRYVVAGNDTFLTSVGVNAGIGFDFVVGRELGFGLDATYHYPIPKNISLSDGNTFNLASPWASVSLRLSF
jgi:hypothetical protein